MRVLYCHDGGVVILDPIRWPTRAAPLATAASLDVRARALRTLEEHRSRMRRSAELVARSRALCAATEPALAAAPPHPHLRLVPRDDAAPPRGLACARFGCDRPAAFMPLVVLFFATRRVIFRGLPRRVCDAHARDLAALSRTPQFLDELRDRVRRRGGEPPGALQVEFAPIH
jgi:hypothetical protein